MISNQRPAFFASKFCRLLTKTAAAMTLGADVCWMLTVIAHQEDSIRYTRPINYWNDQLMALCGFGSKKRLATARKRACSAGWLEYEKGGNRKPGRYRVTLPPELSIEMDGSCHEDDIEVQGNDSELEGVLQGGETELEKVQSNDLLPKAEFETAPMRNSNSAPSIPIPVPIPIDTSNLFDGVVKPTFDDFWEVVHRRVGKGSARKAWCKAIKRLGIESESPEQYLIERMSAFASSSHVKDPIKGGLHPSTWLNDERYDDDEMLWNEQAERDTAVRLKP